MRFLSLAGKKALPRMCHACAAEHIPPRL